MNDAAPISRREQALRNRHRRKAGNAARSLARARQAANPAAEELARTRLLRHRLGAEGQAV
jgi:hypothetical protein